MNEREKTAVRQQRFAEEYIIDLKAAAAARRAGYTGTEESIRVTASRLLTKANISAEITRLMAERRERTKIEADSVIRELSHIAFLDIRGAFLSDGTVRPVQDMPEGVVRALYACEAREQVSNRKRVGSLTKLRFLSKLAALELLGRHIGMFTERHEIREMPHDQMDDVPIEVLLARIAELRERMGKSKRPTQQERSATHGQRK